ncbi:hypothetical protein GCM10014719_40330 [Planomonospora parontospora subsp. antibiotica]|nr:hypothetical protein GCM10014719_40330 [Planomonospora parontospora subsp. antibiotica]GII17249.1 hypothetical protein Ppa05_39750 [Planomonospora parontospora subsp. antibiotica]
MRIDQWEHDGAVVYFTAGLLAALVRVSDPALSRAALREALPWVSFLPDDDAETFLTSWWKWPAERLRSTTSPPSRCC